MTKRCLSFIVAVFCLLSMPLSVFADYTYKNDQITTWSADNTYRVYNDPSVYGVDKTAGAGLGLPVVDFGNISDMKEVADSKSIVPSVEEAARASGDIINVNAQASLYGMKSVVNHLNTKQITIADFEAIMWSFIVSQFATPYEENILDVLNHNVFQQMINENLEITAVPSATTGNVMLDEVWKPNTQVADKVKFTSIANTIKKNTQYRVLYGADGQQINLMKFLTAGMGDVFYIADTETTISGVENNQALWDNRADLVSLYSSKAIVTKQKFIPVYVSSNVTMIQNQINLGSFLKGQSPYESTAAANEDEDEVAIASEKVARSGEATFAAIIGTVSETGATSASGSMGSKQMYIDSFGNICVYHDNKMKIVLCNAQNPVFTSRPDEDDKVQDTIKTASGYDIVTKDIPNVVSVNLTLTEQTKTAPSVYTDGGAADRAAVKSNESMAVYSKPLLTVYSQMLTTGNWDSDNSIHFVGDNVREDYPGFLEFSRAYQNSHKNQLIFFKSPNYNVPSEAVTQVKNSYTTTPIEFTVFLKWASEDNVVYNGVNMKTDLRLGDSAGTALGQWWQSVIQNFSGTNLGSTQSLIKFDDGFFKNWGMTSALSDEVVKNTAPVLLWSNLQAYVGKDTGTPYRWITAQKAMNGVIPGTVQLDIMNVYNHMMIAGMGFDETKMIPGTLFADNNRATASPRSYTLGGLLVPTLDFGQYWEIANEYNAKDATVEDIRNGVMGGLAAGVDGEQWLLRPGLMKPMQRIEWTIKSQDYENLKVLIDKASKGSSFTGWGGSNPFGVAVADETTGLKNWIKAHEQHAFVDNVFLQLRDTRISDSWVIYDKEEVALLGYTWLNYYLPRSLYPRMFLDGSYETSPLLKKFVDNYNKGTVAGASSEENSRGTLAETAYIDGSTSRVWKDTQVIIGPYAELFGGSASDFIWKFYPDTSPIPAVVEQSNVVSNGSDNNSVISTELVYSDHVEINVYDLLMGLYRNTDSAHNNITAEQTTSSEVQSVDKNDILVGSWMFVKNTGSTVVSWAATILQSVHRSLANGSFGDFFQVGWLTSTEVWTKISQYYFIAVLSLATIASLYVIFSLLWDKQVGLFTTIRKLGISVMLTMVPVLLMNFMVYGLDATSKGLLTTTLNKAAVAETSVLVTGATNANADFEYNYQKFRQQFDSLEDVLGKYGYQLPVSYYSSVNQFKYTNQNLQDSMNSVTWTSNQGLSKWYDYRAFVPVQKDRYSKDLYYYFYDYIKWQYLQYLATSPTENTSLRLQDRATSYVFGTPTGYNGNNLEKIQKECLSFDGEYAWLNNGGSADLATTKARADFIATLDKLMMESTGDFYIMMHDPNYIYGESFLKESHDRYGGYYLEDLFGLGYLLTDIKEYVAEDYDTWEPSDELYKYPGWVRFSKNSALQQVTPKTGSNVAGFQNQKIIIDAADSDLQKNLANGEATRDGIVFASRMSLINQVGYDARIRTQKLTYTALEKKLIDMNKRIYDRMNSFMRYFPTTTPSEAYISLAAMTASFEFTKEFGGGNFTEAPLEPSGFVADTVTLDSVMKGLFAKSSTDILQSKELMYMLVDNASGFGIAACFIVVLVDLMAFIVLISRNVLMMLIFLFSVILCVFQYIIRRNLRNRTILGVATQCGGLFLAHAITTVGLNLLTYYSVSNQSLWQDIMISLSMFLMFAVDAFIHGSMLYIVFKDFGSFGGNIVASKLQGLKGALQGVLKGDSKINNAKYNKLEQEKQVEGFGLGHSTRAMNRIQKNIARSADSQMEQTEMMQKELNRERRVRVFSGISRGMIALSQIGNRDSVSKDGTFDPIGDRNGEELKPISKRLRVNRTVISGRDNRFESEATVINRDRLATAQEAETQIRSANRDRQIEKDIETGRIQSGGLGSTRGLIRAQNVARQNSANSSAETESAMFSRTAAGGFRRLTTEGSTESNKVKRVKLATNHGSLKRTEPTRDAARQKVMAKYNEASPEIKQRVSELQRVKAA